DVAGVALRGPVPDDVGDHRARAPDSVRRRADPWAVLELAARAPLRVEQRRNADGRCRGLPEPDGSDRVARGSDPLGALHGRAAASPQRVPAITGGVRPALTETAMPDSAGRHHVNSAAASWSTIAA